MAEAIRRRSRTVATYLRDRDVAEADRIAELLKSEGWPFASRSYVVRSAIVVLSDALRGKSSADIANFFVERRRASRPATAPHPDASRPAAS